MRNITTFRTGTGKEEFSIVTDSKTGEAGKVAYLIYDAENGERYRYAFLTQKVSEEEAVALFNQQLDELGIR